MAAVEWTETPLTGLAQDGVALTAAWTWERGWTVHVSVRWSGSQEWETGRTYEGLSTPEMPQLLEDLLNERA